MLHSLRISLALLSFLFCCFCRPSSKNQNQLQSGHKESKANNKSKISSSSPQLSLADENGAPIKSDQVSHITPPKIPLPSQEELLEVLTKKPFDFDQEHPKPFSRLELENESQKVQQVIAILVNRGFLEWKDNLLYDHANKAVSKGMIEDFMERFDILLATAIDKQKKNQSSAALNLTADETKAQDETSASSESKIFNMDNLAILAGLTCGLGGIMWSYREYMAANAAMEIKTKKINTSNKHIQTVKDEKLKKVGGNLLNFNSPRNQKYIYAPILLTGALATLGVTANQIYEKTKDDK